MIVTWSKGAADSNMPESLLTELADRIAVHPWWQARTELVLCLLNRLNIHPPMSILDLGCGWGTTFKVLEKYGFRVAGCDISRKALERLDRPDRLLIEADITQPIPGQKTFDVVLALDVIEHLDNDREAVKHIHELLCPGGVAIISVPALPDLYSEFDRIQGHRRRYIPETLRNAFVDTAFNLESIFWWGAWLVPVLKYQRRKKEQKGVRTESEAYERYLKLPPWPLSWFFRIAFALEKHSAVSGRLSTGTSLFAVARSSRSERSKSE